jgi:hypothetical protein
MAAKSNLVKLATGSGKKATPVKEEKKEVVKEKVLSPTEQRDLKAKEVVKELLVDVDLTLKTKKDDLLEVDAEPSSLNKGDMWLQEQVSLLASENQNLQNELQVIKADYTKLFNETQRLKGGGGSGANDEELKRGILTVFHEIQANYMKNPGFTTQPTVGTPNFVIVPAAFLNRMIQFFPFLAHEKRFK